jgi:hypothetical protein
MRKEQVRKSIEQPQSTFKNENDNSNDFEAEEKEP